MAVCINAPAHRSCRPTIKDVVERSDFSIGTVSNAINSPDRVAPDTLAQVRQAMDELGYRPTAAARSLEARRSFMLAYPIFTSAPASIMGEFFQELISRADDHRLGDTVVAVEPGRRDRTFASLIAARAADAIVLSEVLDDDERVRWLIDNDVPFEPSAGPGPGYDYTRVDIDIEQGMADLAEHLIDLGRERFAFVEWDGRPTSWFRRQGYQRALCGPGTRSGAPDR